MTHWSSRLLAADLGLSNVTIAKVWRKWNLQRERDARLVRAHRRIEEELVEAARLTDAAAAANGT